MTELPPNDESANSRSHSAHPVLLSDVVFEMESQPEEWSVFVDRKTGQVVGVPADAFQAAEARESGDDEYFGDATPEMIELAGRIESSSEYVRLPDQFEIHEWEIMRDFVTSVENDAARDRLLNAIHGKGAFRYFKDAVFELELRDEWFAFRDAAIEAIAIRWLEANNLVWTRDRNTMGET